MFNAALDTSYFDSPADAPQKMMVHRRACIPPARETTHSDCVRRVEAILPSGSAEKKTPHAIMPQSVFRRFRPTQLLHSLEPSNFPVAVLLPLDQTDGSETIIKLVLPPKSKPIHGSDMQNENKLGIWDDLPE